MLFFRLVTGEGGKEINLFFRSSAKGRRVEGGEEGTPPF